MEQIKVNMTPCGFTPTIHASQNDNATRKWAFDLYDENGKIDSSDIKEQMIFDSRVGGTEQILPENGSDPTTSPIIADIQYPDSLRSEQTFLYRESPTQQDGQAKITKIKGNTVVFNQLIQNGNFADNSKWSTSSVTFTVSGDIATVSSPNRYGHFYQSISANIANHLVFVTLSVKKTGESGSVFVKLVNDFGYQNANFTREITDNDVWTDVVMVGTYQTTPSGSTATVKLGIQDYRVSNSNNGFQVKNVMLIDLTQLNNSAITDASSFRSRYNLPYYDYTTGKLLPFKGESLKTTGKNILEITASTQTINGITYTVNEDGTITANGTATANAQFTLNNNLSGDEINGCTLNGVEQTGSSSTWQISIQEFGGSWTGYGNDYGSGITINGTNGKRCQCYIMIRSGVTANNLVFKPMIRKYGDASFEPYISSTINLPTLTYFPTGMKSAGSVYDEITESKAITRVGSVDLGSLTWERRSATGGVYRFLASVPNIKPMAVRTAPLVCPILTTISNGEAYSASWDKVIYNDGNSTNVFVHDYQYTTVDSFTSAMSGVYLYFELDAPTEQSITTASLVTEKGESPLYYDDELIADCNETISSESGIFDAKIKLMDDNTIYSQKIQLHVERKP